MSPNMPQAHPNAWAQLGIFRIFKDVFPGNTPTPKLFNNTRQQCPDVIMLCGRIDIRRGDHIDPRRDHWK